MTPAEELKELHLIEALKTMIRLAIRAGWTHPNDAPERQQAIIDAQAVIEKAICPPC